MLVVLFTGISTSLYRHQQVSLQALPLAVVLTAADEVLLADHMYCQGDEADECDAISSGKETY